MNIQAAPSASPLATPSPTPAGRRCRCIACAEARGERLLPRCPTCGFKRCPGGTDHRNRCTGSNAPGQPGSAYGFAVAKSAADARCVTGQAAAAAGGDPLREVAVALRALGYEMVVDARGCRLLPLARSCAPGMDDPQFHAVMRQVDSLVKVARSRQPTAHLREALCTSIAQLCSRRSYDAALNASAACDVVRAHTSNPDRHPDS